VSESKYPPRFTPEWWAQRRQVVAQIIEQQKRQRAKWTPEQIAKSKRDEYAAFHGREPAADEEYANTSGWWDA
jgi:hypothetical protein